MAIDGSVCFIGAACLDIILRVQAYPKEDAEARVSDVCRAAGGNATNAAMVCAQLLRAYIGDARCGVHLVAPVSDPALDGDSAALVAAVRRAGVCAAGGLVAVAPAGLPTSYIALAPASRTILHARTIRELVDGEAAAALSCTACCAGGAGYAWVHAEGRALDATAKAFAAARLNADGAGELRPVLSLELEKARPDGDVEALVPLADVVFVSREYACGVRSLADAPAAIAHVLAAAAAAGAAPPALIVAPWGAAGAWAAASGCGLDESQAERPRTATKPAARITLRMDILPDIFGP